MTVTTTRARKPRFIAGGPDETPDDQQQEPQRARFECQAAGCPMPGTMFPGSATRGVCAWHYATNASDWPRITQALTDWRCVSSEINQARRVLCDPDICTDVRAQDAEFRAAWQRLEPAMAAGGWKPDDYAPARGESYGSWANRLQHFLAARIGEAVKHRPDRSAAISTARALADSIRPPAYVEEPFA
jgi:hypothetical protein